MKHTNTLFLIGILFSFTAFGQTHNAYYQTLVNQVSASEIESNLTDFVGFGEKQLGSNAEANCLDWLVDMYESWGYTDIQQQEVTAWGESGYNLIVTKQGTVYPDTYIIVDGHYDTINGPGANDNGSGTSVILEMARILKDIPTEYSIKFIHFTAEEWGLIGSYEYVENIAVPQNLDIRLVYNIDQVGGVNGDINDTIYCDVDQSAPNGNNSESEMFTNQLSTCMELYSDLMTTFGPAYGSDYVPFQEEGFVITGLYEYNESPYPHSPQDTMANVDLDFIFQVAKGALGSLCHFAVVQEDMGVNDSYLGTIQVAPNPVDNQLTIQSNNSKIKTVKLSDLVGKTVFSGQVLDNVLKIDTSSLPNGVYILSLTDGINHLSKKIIVQHK